MADGDTGYITPTTAATLIPTLQLDKILMALMPNLVAAACFTQEQTPEGAGAFQFPKMKSIAAETITPGTALVGRQNTEGGVTITPNHWEGVPVTVSRQTLVQANKNYSVLDRYHEIGANGIAKKFDADLLGTYDSAHTTIACAVSGVASHMTAATITEGMQVLKDHDAPDDGRFHLIVCPREERAIIDSGDFIPAYYYGSDAVVRGGKFIGTYLGVNVHVTSQVALSTTRKNILCHESFIGYGIQGIWVDPWQWNTLKQAYDAVVSMLYGYSVEYAEMGVCITTAP